MKPDMANPNLRFASLDMRGRLVIDVHGAIAAGVWADEIVAARELGRIIAAKHKPIPYRITEAGKAYLEGRECKHDFVLDQEAPLHSCCQKCGALWADQ